MNKMQSEITHVSKQRGYRFWLGCVTFLLGLPLLYYGYCWGWWGRSSLLMQYLFQCSCPAASEEARYPEEVDVIVPACSYDFSRLSPSGRFLYVREKNLEMTSVYILDLQSMERIKVTNQPFTSFLTDDLWFVESGLNKYIMDRITGVQYPIQKFVYSHPNAQINNETNLILLAESLMKSENIFLVGDSTDTVVALVSDFRTYPELNFIADRFDIPGFDIERFLQENNISYQSILPDFPHEVASSMGKLIARDEGIYIIETNQVVTKAPPSLVRGWTWDGKGVIYSSGGRCLIRRGLPFTDDIGCAIQVPQPVLRLKVPEEYLLPTESP